MPKSIHEYIKDYRYKTTISKVAVGISVASILNANIWSAITPAIWASSMYLLAKLQKEYCGSAIEYKRLNACYEVVKDEIVKNIKELGMTDVEGIFTYFMHLRINNLFSYNRTLPYYQIENMFGEENIIKALILNNHGVCRNYVPAFNDICAAFNIDSKAVIIDHFKTAEHIIVNAEDVLTEEDFKKLEALGKITPETDLDEFIKKHNDALKEIFGRVTKEMEEQGYFDINNKQKHCISVATDENNSYLLDPSLNQFYMDKDELGQYRSNAGSYFKVVKSKTYGREYKHTMSTNLVIPKPLKDPKEMIEDLNKRVEYISDISDSIMEMYTKIQPVLEEADEAYKYILKAQ